MSLGRDEHRADAVPAPPPQAKQMLWVPWSDVRIGMFVHPLNTPAYLLRRQSDLRGLKVGGVHGIWVDLARSTYAPRQERIRPPADCPAPSPELERRRPVAVAPPAEEGSALASRFGRAADTLRRLYKPVESLLDQARLGNTLSTDSVKSIVEDVTQAVHDDASALIGLSRMRTKDAFTYMHSIAVCALMINLGQRLGLDRGSLEELGVAGLLHDVGKMMVPPEVLNKPGPLTPPEMEVMRSHVVLGHDLLKRMPSLPASALDVCLNHHEKYDGSGYPHGIAGDRISLAARMGAICDVYDAITSKRPYKEAWTPSECLAGMFTWKGHFDDQLLAHFIKSIGIYPVGSLIRLRSDHLALVLEQNEADLTKPLVRVFYSIQARQKIPMRDVVLAIDGSDAVVAREDPGRWGFFDWDHQWPRMIAG